MISKEINIKLLKEKYAVCQLGATEEIPEWSNKGEFISVTRTRDELSIVCLEKDVPKEIKKELNWNILKIEGQLDFSLVGILAAISSILAKKAISIFVISTFNTDYILVKEKDTENALNVLIEEGYVIKR